MPYDYLPRASYGSGALPALAIQPVGFAQFEQQENSAAEAQADRSLLPMATELKKAGMGNAMLAQVADEAQASDPDSAPSVWDKGMQRLSDQGFDVASQYVGHYRPDLAERVSDVYSGRAQATKSQNMAANSNFDEGGAYRAIQQMPPQARMQALQRQNAAIEAFNQVKDEASWNQEVGKLRDMGLPVDTIFQKGADWRYNYGIAHNLLQSLTPVRDLLARSVMSEATGAPAPAPITNYGRGGAGGGQYVGTDENGRPLTFDKNSRTYFDADGQPYYGKINAKPSTAMTTFQAKLDIARQSGMGEADALQFANGKKQLSDAEMMNMALTRANQELGDITLAGNPPPDPDAWVRSRTTYNYNLMKGTTTAAPAAGQTPQAPGAGGQWARMSKGDQDASLANARAAIKRNPGSRQAVIRKLQAAGAPTQGL